MPHSHHIAPLAPRLPTCLVREGPPDFMPFDEGVFPVSLRHAGEYLRACNRGYARMRQCRVVITGLCRDIEHLLPATILRFERLSALFADSRFVIYENDSRDGTAALLRQWAAHNRRVASLTEHHNDPINPVRRCASRASRMAYYRDRCQHEILGRYGHFDVVIVLDMDLVGGWSEDGVANTFGHDGWDVMGSNGMIYRRSGFAINQVRQYDTWAYRQDDSLRPLTSARVAPRVPARGEPPIRIGSCFGGLGAYRMEAFAAGTYAGGDCEHVTFHRSLRDRGFSRIFLNPSQITMYGRRHRSTDRAVCCMLQAWSRLGGQPPQEWLFAKDSPAPGPTRGAIRLAEHWALAPHEFTRRAA